MNIAQIAAFAKMIDASAAITLETSLRRDLRLTAFDYQSAQYQNGVSEADRVRLQALFACFACAEKIADGFELTDSQVKGLIFDLNAFFNQDAA